MTTTDKVKQLIESTPWNATECFAIPGEFIIDTINSDTGRTHIYSKTLDECREEYALAERMFIDDFCKAKAARQDSPIVWEETTEEYYDEMLDVLPPVGWCQKGFLVGEPTDHHAVTGAPRYQALLRRNGKIYRSTRPLTKKEFQEV